MSIQLSIQSQKIKALVEEWKASLATLDMIEPTMKHHQLLMLVAEMLVEIERRLDFFDGHTHSTSVGGMMGLTIGAPEQRRDI